MGMLRALTYSFCTEFERFESRRDSNMSYYKAKYSRTRVVGVARRNWEDTGYRMSDFWYSCSDNLERFFRDAERQLAIDPNCWGRFYKLKRRFHATLSAPIYLALWIINKNHTLFGLSFKQRCVLSGWMIQLDRNPNIVVSRA